LKVPSPRHVGKKRKEPFGRREKGMRNSGEGSVHPGREAQLRLSSGEDEGAYLPLKRSGRVGGGSAMEERWKEKIWPGLRKKSTPLKKNRASLEGERKPVFPFGSGGEQRRIALA